MALTGLLKGLLSQVTATDPETCGSVPALLLIAALAACSRPPEGRRGSIHSRRCGASETTVAARPERRRGVSLLEPQLDRIADRPCGPPPIAWCV
jgi:hypothetical protein